MREFFALGYTVAQEYNISMAATLTLSDDQVVQLIRQLPVETRTQILREMLHPPTVNDRVRENENRLRELFKQRGLDFEGMSPHEIETVISDIADGR